MSKKHIVTTWEVWVFDVWGNSKDGYDVNDRTCIDRDYPLTLKVTRNNPGTPQQFDSAYPSNAQLKAAFGIKFDIDVQGDDTHIDISRDRDGMPIGEMYCTSHESLSPIRENTPAIA